MLSSVVPSTNNKKVIRVSLLISLLPVIKSLKYISPPLPLCLPDIKASKRYSSSSFSSFSSKRFFNSASLVNALSFLLGVILPLYTPKRFATFSISSSQSYERGLMEITRVPVCFAMISAFRRSNSGWTKMTRTPSFLQRSISPFRWAGDGSLPPSSILI